jgi:hypothetical protein
MSLFENRTLRIIFGLRRDDEIGRASNMNGGEEEWE